MPIGSVPSVSDFRPSIMPRQYVTVLVALALSTLLVAPVGAHGPPAEATTDTVTRQEGCIAAGGSEPCAHQVQANTFGARLSGRVQQELPPNRSGRQGQQPQPMSASASQTGPNSFRVTVQGASFGESADANPPGQVDDAGLETDFRTLTVVSRGGAASFDLDFTVDRNLTSVTSDSAPGPPDEFDTALLYSSLETTASSGDFGIRYEFDVETDRLREFGADRNDIVVSVYRDGRWRTADVDRIYRAGNETVVRTSAIGPGVVALGLRHAAIRVTNVTPREQPVLSNRTSRLELTVENRGSQAGTEQLRLTADGRPLATPTVSVPARSQRTVTVPVTFQRPGERDLEIGEYETRINVTQPKPDISVAQLSVDRTRIQTGETVTVDARVTNTGTGAGTETVQFRAFGDVVDAKAVPLNPGETRTVQFTQRFDAPGEFQVGVENRTTAVTVSRGSDWETTPTDELGPTTPDEEESEAGSPFQWVLILIGASVVALLGFMTVGRLIGR